MGQTVVIHVSLTLPTLEVLNESLDTTVRQRENLRSSAAAAAAVAAAAAEVELQGSKHRSTDFSLVRNICLRGGKGGILRKLFEGKYANGLYNGD